MNSNIYSDLAMESACFHGSKKINCPELKEYDFGFAKLYELHINNGHLSDKYNRPIGRYLTISTDKIWLMNETENDALSSLIENEISKLIRELIPHKEKKSISALVVGLGNSEITSDAIGPKTVSRLTVTRHIAKIDPTLFAELDKCRISAITPGVLSQTGIETLELVKSAVEKVSPDVVLVIDALASRSCQRLGRTVQISDSGIAPGSGIGNFRNKINKESLGVPVIAIGVPTVVDSATLVYDALECADMNDVPQKLIDVLDNKRSFFVTPKECDVICNSVSVLLAHSIDQALSLQ